MSGIAENWQDWHLLAQKIKTLGRLQKKAKTKKETYKKPLPQYSYTQALVGYVLVFLSILKVICEWTLIQENDSM